MSPDAAEYSSVIKGSQGRDGGKRQRVLVSASPSGNALRSCNSSILGTVSPVRDRDGSGSECSHSRTPELGTRTSGNLVP